MSQAVLLFLLLNGKAQLQNFSADVLLADAGGVIIHRQTSAVIDADGGDPRQGVQSLFQPGTLVAAAGLPQRKLHAQVRHAHSSFFLGFHRTNASAALCGNFAPSMRCNFLKYAQYSCKIAPLSDAKFARKSLLLHDTVLP